MVTICLILNKIKPWSEILHKNYLDTETTSTPISVKVFSSSSTVHIVISKTKNHCTESYIRVPVTLPLVHSERGCQTLQQLIASCRKDDVASPFLVHHKPGRKLKSKEKEHWTQLSPKQISDGFTQAAKDSGFFGNLKAGERPTLHECIALVSICMRRPGSQCNGCRRYAVTPDPQVPRRPTIALNG